MASEELTLRPRGEGAGRLGLWLGIALAAVAAVLIAIILSGGTDSEKVVPATRVAVVAAQDIPARTRITADMLQISTFELSEVSADAFTTETQLINRVTATEVKSGQVVVPAMVSTTAGENLTFNVSPGMRGLSIGVQEVVTAGGNLTPGDRVDIIGVVEVAPNTDIAPIIAALTGEPAPFGPTILNRPVSVTFTLLHNVKVLAVAQNQPNQVRPAATTTAGGGNNPAPNDTINPDASTVTLELTPQQAQIMAIADNKATLRLSLRPFGEEGRGQTFPIFTFLD